MDNKQATLELGTKPVGKLLIQYALPAIVAMTAASLYNIVDSIFIGQGVGPFAISGLAITFPFMNLSSAFGAAVGVGSSTYISVKLGQKDYKTAENILGNTVVLNLIIENNLPFKPGLCCKKNTCLLFPKYSAKKVIRNMGLSINKSTKAPNLSIIGFNQFLYIILFILPSKFMKKASINWLNYLF